MATRAAGQDLAWRADLAFQPEGVEGALALNLDLAAWRHHESGRLGAHRHRLAAVDAGRLPVTLHATGRVNCVAKPAGRRHRP